MITTGLWTSVFDHRHLRPCVVHRQQAAARVQHPRCPRAQAKQVLSAALGRRLILLASGSVVGMLLGVAASRVLSAIVYHATAQDPFVLGAVALTLLLTGSLSVAGPVRRVLHVDPANVLREQ
jgi:predicted lysophospholipase L1 biosynthesis ABC-type transport system permease subunit